MKIYQQGDVLIKKINFLPSGKSERVANKILAYGEHTGHKHQILDVVTTVGIIEDNIPSQINTSIEVLKILGKLYVKALREWTVVHEEHKKITVPPGIYEIDIVREYDHFTEEARQVAD